MSQYALPRNERLRSKKSIRRLFESGRSGFVYPFRYLWLDMGEADGRQPGVADMIAESAADAGVAVMDDALCASGSEIVDGGVNLVQVVDSVVDAESDAAGEGTARVEVMFLVPKKFQRRANKRNLLRRRTKESYRLSNGGLKQSASGRHLTMALIYSTKEVLSYKTINHAVEKILAQVCRSL